MRRPQGVVHLLGQEGLWVALGIGERVAAWLVLGVNNMKTSLSGGEPLNRATEPGFDLLEIDVVDVTKSVRAKNRCNAGWLETAGPTFLHFFKLFGALGYQFLYLV
jgi:hypothetical protein